MILYTPQYDNFIFPYVGSKSARIMNFMFEILYLFHPLMKLDFLECP